MKRKIMPPTFFYIFIILAIILDFIFPIKEIIYYPYNYFGILIIILGIGMDIWAWNLFREKGTTLNPYKKATKLEISGPFRISRNSMYLGMAIALLGLSVLLGSLISLVFPILFVFIIDRMYVIHEEKSMEKTFGKKYLDYKRRVRRWI